MHSKFKPQTPIKALLFDLGGVVFDIDFNRIFSAWSQYTDLSAEQIRAQFSMNAEYEQYERGEIDGAPARLKALLWHADIRKAGF